jgi:hypothetical protein
MRIIIIALITAWIGDYLVQTHEVQNDTARLLRRGDKTDTSMSLMRGTNPI